MSNAQPLADERGILPRGEIRALVVGLVVAGVAWGGSQFFPDAELEWFARGAAQLAAWFTGAPINRTATGWLLAGNAQPVVVSEACSATGYFLTVVALLGWRFARMQISPLAVLGGAFAGGVLVALFVNALRVVAVMHAHHWVIPRFPASYAPFLHMLTGVAVFLPALIALNLALEYYGTHRHRFR